MTQAEFQQITSTLPGLPGIYKYYDAANELLYVGKAKNIRKRVSSYFNKTLASYKTHELVKRIRKIEFTIVSSEQDAFLLENSLIKQFQPLFNINLKDDKTYPYIVIKNEPFPRIFLTRQKIEDGSRRALGPDLPGNLYHHCVDHGLSLLVDDGRLPGVPARRQPQAGQRDRGKGAASVRREAL